MNSRKLVVLFASAALVTAPVLTTQSQAQTRAPMANMSEGAGGYLMPVMIGVMDVKEV